MVYIKKITMTGFKSFGRGTKTIHLSPGFTCIVGPNGSGKSNAIDAINFCLGELSKKSMRASTMTDLLYNGVKGDEPSQKAIVAVEFDNSDNRIPVKGKSVSIQRELKSNGRGVYRLNGKRITRGEIIDVLKVSNIDVSEGYNIIQQGQISEIALMSPIERRELLEEIAGIKGFDEKKEAAVADLEEAQRKMGEVNVLIGELTDTVEKLREEKEEAERAIELDKRIQAHRVTYLSARMHEAKTEIDQLNVKIDELMGKVKQVEQQKSNLEEIAKFKQAIAQKQQERSSIQQQEEKAEAVIQEFNIQLAKLDTQHEHNTSKNREIKQNIKNTEQEIQKTEDKIYDYENRLEEVKNTSVTLERDISDLEQDKEVIIQKIQENEEQYLDAKDQYDQINSDYRRVREQITKSEISVDMQSSMLESFENNKEVKEKQINEVEKSLAEIKGQINNAFAFIEDANEKLEDAKMQIDTYKERIEQHKIAIKEKQEEYTRVSDESIVLSTRIDMINMFLEDKDKNKARGYLKEQHIPGVIGTLEEVMGGKKNVPPHMRHLGQAIVTDSVSTAVACARKLKEDVVGSSKFIPLDKLNINIEQARQSISKRFTSLTMFVDDFEQGVELWRTSDNLEIHTEAGDIFYPSGVFSGGFHMSTAKYQLEPLEAEKREKERTLNGIKDDIRKLENILQQSERILQINREQADLIKRESNKTINQIQNLQQRQKQEETSLERLISERDTINTRIEEKQSQVDRDTRTLEEQQYQEEDILKKLNEAQQKMDELDVSPLEQQLEELKTDIVNLEKEQIRSEENQVSYENSIQESKEKIEDLKQRKEQLEKDLADNKRDHTEIMEKISSIKEKMDEKNKELKEIRNKIRDVNRAIDQDKRSLEEINRNNEKLDAQIQRIEKNINDVKLDRAKVEAKQDALIQEAREYDIQIKSLSDKEAEEISPKSVKRKLNEAVEERGKLVVNMRSIEEYKVQKKRYDILTDTKKVLEAERKVILDTIVQIETEKKRLFLRTYNAIDKNFNEIFKSLADGDAYMTLENPEDIFEGGITISAHPKGKKVKSIESMSGGEKTLTAISFVFAIQNSAPQPFYVLDEIDAALDEANVQKVGTHISKMAQGYSKFGQAQFLVISHRDSLMARADKIYGTTNIDGLTQMYQLELTDEGLQRRITETQVIRE